METSEVPRSPAQLHAQALSGRDSVHAKLHSDNDPSAPALSTATDTPDTSTGSDLLSALSRFEFETNKGNDGTKVLLVEWEDPRPAAAHLPHRAEPRASASSRSDERGNGSVDGPFADVDWEVTWDGKGPHLPAHDHDDAAGGHGHDGDDGSRPKRRRVYYLLPPGAAIPPLVNISLSQAGGGRSGGEGDVPVHEDAPPLRLTTKPLPAIFPPGLGVSSSDKGTRGVLHTRWAKRRLAELQGEMDSEMLANGESVGLEMALQERQWILDHFGLGTGPAGGRPLTLSTSRGSSWQQQHLPSPTSPRPQVGGGGGKLGEKLRGLKLATTAAELAAAAGRRPAAASRDMTSFSNFMRHGEPAAVASMSASTSAAPAPVGIDTTASLDAVLDGTAGKAGSGREAPDGEEDLFALPMSPRSPEMTKSPFSFR